MDARLDKPIESWGTFKLAPAEAPSIRGKLCYAPDLGIELELVESPISAAQRFQPHGSEIKRLLGQLVDGTLVTLFDCFVASGTIYSGGGIGAPAKVVANRALFGRHVTDLDQLQIKSIAVELSSLSNWTGSRPVTVDQMRDSSMFGFTASVRKPQPIDVSLPRQTFDLQIAHRLHTGLGTADFNVEWAAGLRLVAKESLPFETINELAWQCQNLISLLVGEPLSVREVILVAADQQPPPPPSREQIALRAFSLYSSRPSMTGSADDDWFRAESQLRLERAQRMPPTLQFVFQQIGKHDRADVHSPFMLLPYGMVENVFGNMVERWCARTEQAVLAANVFFGAQDVSAPAVNVKFLTMAQAAESYHRSLGIGLYMDQRAFDVAIRHVTTQIPAVIQGDHRLSLINRLRYGNEHSLRKRLAAMFAKIPQCVQVRIASDASQFIHRIVETRNYFTHYDQASKANSFEGRDAFVAAERIRILIVANLLHDLGVADKDLLGVLERHRAFRHWMDEQLLL